MGGPGPRPQPRRVSAAPTPTASKSLSRPPTFHREMEPLLHLPPCPLPHTSGGEPGTGQQEPESGRGGGGGLSHAGGRAAPAARPSPCPLPLVLGASHLPVWAVGVAPIAANQKELVLFVVLFKVLSLCRNTETRQMRSSKSHGAALCHLPRLQSGHCPGPGAEGERQGCCARLPGSEGAQRSKASGTPLVH